MLAHYKRIFSFSSQVNAGLLGDYFQWLENDIAISQLNVDLASARRRLQFVSQIRFTTHLRLLWSLAGASQTQTIRVRIEHSYDNKIGYRLN